MFDVKFYLYSMISLILSVDSLIAVLSLNESIEVWHYGYHRTRFEHWLNWASTPWKHIVEISMKWILVLIVKSPSPLSIAVESLVVPDSHVSIVVSISTTTYESIVISTSSTRSIIVSTTNPTMRSTVISTSSELSVMVSISTINRTSLSPIVRIL